MNRSEKRRRLKTDKKAVKSRTRKWESPANNQAINRSMQHHNGGRLSQAEAGYRDILQRTPNHPVALHYLGVLAVQSGHSKAAVELISKAISVWPKYAEAHYNLGNVFRELGRFQDAINGYQKSLVIQPDYIDALGNLGATYQKLGLYQDAANYFRKMIALSPDLSTAHTNLGAALTKLGQFDEAVACNQKAIELKPDSAEAHCNLGSAFMGLEKFEAAQLSFEYAIKVQSDFVLAHSNLAEVFEKTNRTDDLRSAVADAKRYCSNDLRLALHEAQLLMRDGDFATARSVLENAPEQQVEAQYLSGKAQLLGKVCDRLGDAKAAFAYFENSNRLSLQTPEAKHVDARRYRKKIEQSLKYATPEWVESWTELTPDEDQAAPVFLVGFPRSGTTLLDTILRSHPEISIAEEAPTILCVKEALIHKGGNYAEAVAGLDAAGLAALRSLYFEQLNKHIDATAKTSVVIDKMPLHLIDADLIHRLFPKARFVFLLRHPCDCVFSCFMQEFQLNDAMANFLDLQDAATLYDKSMQVWEQYQATLPLQVHTVHYEALIDDLQGTIEPILKFLGLNWEDRLKDYAATALKRKKINTPSYNQVTQPLYSRARGRWVNYTDNLEPVLPTLLPWAKHFGYE